MPEAIQVVTASLLDGITCPPTDLEALFSRLNVINCQAADIPVNGELRKAGKSYEIAFSPHLTPSRQRFTIAHELGHALLATTGPRCPQSGDEVERICDMVAAAILLPRQHFVEAVSNDRSPATILKISVTFQVSVISAAIRYAGIFKESVFEVEESRVTWGHGFIKKGFVTSDIKPSVDQAMEGGVGEEIVFVNNGRNKVCLKWAPIGNSRRALFVAVPAK